jgi:hypothetical protein
MNLKISWESNPLSRSTYLLALILTLCLTRAGLAQFAPSPVLTTREIAQQARQSVVTVVTEDSTGSLILQGSGFFVKDDLIATNFHLIKDARWIKVRLAGQRDFYVVQEVAQQDKLNDLALLKVSGMSAKSLPLSNGAQVRIGDEVFVVSNPEGLEGTFSQGIVSAARGMKLIQITAPLSRGSSGAPVMNRRGEVIGVAVGLFENGQNLNFAIPEIYLRTFFLSPTEPLPIAIGDPEYGKHISQERRAPEPTGGPERSVASPKLLVGSWADKGKAYIVQKRYLDAIEALKKAVWENDDDWQAYELLGMAYGSIKRYEEAIDAYKQAIRIKPDDYSPHMLLGLACNLTYRYEEAVNAFRQALRIKPNSREARESLRKAYESLGITLSKNERHEEVINDN